MRRFRPLSSLAALPIAVAVALAPAFANPGPVVGAMPVSPGAPVEGAVIATRCPTYSWGAATGAEAYELAIFDARNDHRADYGIQMARGAPRLQERILAPALSWTPAGRGCLEEDEDYLWFVRPLRAEGEGEWSEGWFFRVEGVLEGLSEVVRREVQGQLGDPAVWREGLERLQQEAPETHAAASRWLAATTSPRLAELLRPEATTELSEADSLAPMATEVVTQLATFPNPAAFRVARAGGVLFHGDQGGIPAERAGTRLMWYPGKAAFRAGAVGVDGVSSDAWNDVNIGLRSFATGQNTIASGSASTAMGERTMAIGSVSTAMGRGPNASGFVSTAMGNFTTASGLLSNAMGDFTTASGSRSTAMGTLTTASDEASTALGERTTASGRASTAMGWSTTASNSASTAMGYFTTASGFASTAMGSNATASGRASTAMGESTRAQAYASLVLGRWNVIAGSTSSWVGTEPVLVVGNGEGDSLRSNAFTLLKNGNLTIAGTYSNGSDRSVKENFAAVDAREVLEKVAALPIETWNYLSQPDTIRHMGPMSQDFRAAFGLGQDEVTISTVDGAGVALAAIQGLHQLAREQETALQEQHATIERQQAALDVLREENRQFAQRVAEVELLRADNEHLARKVRDLAALRDMVLQLEARIAPVVVAGH